MPTHLDSAVKVQGYLDKVASWSIGLQVTPLLLRGYTCQAMCGGCCPRFSLDYLPGELDAMPLDHPARHRLVARTLQPSPQYKLQVPHAKPVNIYSDLQRDHNNYHCRHLDQETGRCTIYEYRPFSCDFELVRFYAAPAALTPHRVRVQLFGRGWRFLRVDGQRGAKCTITPPTPQAIAETRRKFQRLQRWADHLGYRNTKIPKIIAWLDSKQHAPMVL